MVSRRRLLNRKAELAKFEHFLIEMDDVLEKFVDQAKGLGCHLDYSLDSFGPLEEFLLTGAKNSKTTDADIQRSARYIGETIRKVYGGHWKLEIENPKHLYYGLPVIAGHAPSPVKMCPVQAVRMFLMGKPKGFFKQVVMSQIDPPDLNLQPEKE